MMVYGIIRGVLLSPQAENTNLNPYGILIASVVTGMFSVQALEKMNSVVSYVFTPATEIEKQLDRIGTALGIATLDNYQGFVCGPARQCGFIFGGWATFTQRQTTLRPNRLVPASETGDTERSHSCGGSH
jgi:hypothetical protein